MARATFAHRMLWTGPHSMSTSTAPRGTSSTLTGRKGPRVPHAPKAAMKRGGSCANPAIRCTVCHSTRKTRRANEHVQHAA
eukprot:5290636-Prymnesium_polylepis.1